MSKILSDIMEEKEEIPQARYYSGSNADTPDYPDELAEYEKAIEEICRMEG